MGCCASTDVDGDASPRGPATARLTDDVLGSGRRLVVRSPTPTMLPMPSSPAATPAASPLHSITSKATRGTATDLVGSRSFDGALSSSLRNPLLDMLPPSAVSLAPDADEIVEPVRDRPYVGPAVPCSDPASGPGDHVATLVASDPIDELASVSPLAFPGLDANYASMATASVPSLLGFMPVPSHAAVSLPEASAQDARSAPSRNLVSTSLGVIRVDEGSMPIPPPPPPRAGSAIETASMSVPPAAGDGEGLSRWHPPRRKFERFGRRPAKASCNGSGTHGPRVSGSNVLRHGSHSSIKSPGVVADSSGRSIREPNSNGGSMRSASGVSFMTAQRAFGGGTRSAFRVSPCATPLAARSQSPATQNVCDAASPLLAAVENAPATALLLPEAVPINTLISDASAAQRSHWKLLAKQFGLTGADAAAADERSGVDDWFDGLGHETVSGQAAAE